MLEAENIHTLSSYDMTSFSKQSHVMLKDVPHQNYFGPLSHTMNSVRQDECFSNPKLISVVSGLSDLQNGRKRRFPPSTDDGISVGSWAFRNMARINRGHPYRWLMAREKEAWRSTGTAPCKIRYDTSKYPRSYGVILQRDEVQAQQVRSQIEKGLGPRYSALETIRTCSDFMMILRANYH